MEKQTVFAILTEDTYETRVGDGEFHYLAAVALHESEADRRVAELSGESTRTHLRSVTIALAGATLIVDDPGREPHDAYTPEQILKAMEARIAPNVSERRAGDAIVLTASGRIDMSTSGELGVLLIPLARASSAGQRIVVDLSDVLYTDTGWSALMLPAKEARASGVKIVLVSPPHTGIGGRLRISRFDQIFPIFDSVEAALAAQQG